MDLYTWIFTIDSWLHSNLWPIWILAAPASSCRGLRLQMLTCRSTHRSISPKVCYHGYVDCRCLLHIFRHHHGTPLTGVDADLLYRWSGCENQSLGQIFATTQTFHQMPVNLTCMRVSCVKDDHSRIHLSGPPPCSPLLTLTLAWWPSLKCSLLEGKAAMLCRSIQRINKVIVIIVTIIVIVVGFTLRFGVHILHPQFSFWLAKTDLSIAWVTFEDEHGQERSRPS